MIEVVVFHLNTAKNQVVHFEHFDYKSNKPRQLVLPKLSYQNDNLIQRAQHGRFNVQTLTY